MTKKKILSAMLVAIFFVAGINIQKNEREMDLSDLALKNIEALADPEGSSCRWRTGWSSLTGWIAICDEYGVGYNCTCGDNTYN